MQIKPVSPWIFFFRLFWRRGEKTKSAVRQQNKHKKSKESFNYLSGQCFWLLSSDTPLQRGRVQIQRKNCRILFWDPDTKTEIQNTASVSAWSPLILNNTAPETEAQNKPASLLGADDQLLLFFSFQHGCARKVEVWFDSAHWTTPEKPTFSHRLKTCGCTKLWYLIFHWPKFKRVLIQSNIKT